MPLRTLDEMAEEFGLSKRQLVYQMHHSPVKPPTHTLKHRDATWYQPKAMRRWWHEHSAALHLEHAATG